MSSTVPARRPPYSQRFGLHDCPDLYGQRCEWLVHRQHLGLDTAQTRLARCRIPPERAHAGSGTRTRQIGHVDEPCRLFEVLLARSSSQGGDDRRAALAGVGLRQARSDRPQWRHTDRPVWCCWRRTATRAKMRIQVYRGDGHGHRRAPIGCFATMPWTTLPDFTVRVSDVFNIIVEPQGMQRCLESIVAAGLQRKGLRLVIEAGGNQVWGGEMPRRYPCGRPPGQARVTPVLFRGRPGAHPPLPNG